MYLDFFGFDEPPFSITPDPGFVFLSEKHEESLAHLIYGITRGGGAGFVQLTGEVGTGKTTICRMLLQQIPEKTNIALILNPSITPLELLQTICKELGVSTRGIKNQLNGLVDKLNEFLLSSWANGENTVVIIDEAQNIPRDTLEQLRLLTNLETDKQKLLQIILIGQPELRSTMRRNDLRQLAQRVTARYHLMPLSADETYEYILHRIRTAGVTDNLISKSIAVNVYKLTGGIPRLINILLDRALLAAYSENKRQLANNHLKIAAIEVLPENTALHPQNVSNRRLAYMLFVALVAALIAGFYWKDALFPSDANPANGIHQKEKLSASRFQAATPQQTWQKYLALWGSSMESEWNWQQCPDSSDTGLACMQRQGNFTQLENLNRPVILLLKDRSILLVLSIRDDSLGVLNESGQEQTVKKSAIEKKWLGNYMVLWPVPAEILLNPDSQQIKQWSQEMANAISDRPVNKNQLRDWIIEFQRLNGLLADGIIGSETQMALSLKAYDGPTLK